MIFTIQFLGSRGDKEKERKMWRTILAFALGWSVLIAVPFPSAYYPTKNHPRLWLTAERMQALRTLKQKRSQRWRSFKALCDSMIDSDPDNDPWDMKDSPQNYTAPLALMYRLTRKKAYADKALELMDRISTDLSRYGDPDHQSFYFMGLTYDWLYDYAGMSPSRRNRYHRKMKILSDKFWRGWDRTASGTDSDANLLTGNLHLTFGAALYGDYDDAVTMLDRAWTGWVRGYYVDHGTSNRDTVKAALGGVYFTGMAYFPSTDIVGISGYEMTLKSACGYDVNVKEKALKPFWKNIILSMIALTEPTRRRIADYGSWQDPNDLRNQPWLRRAMILSTYFAERAGYRRVAALGSGYAKRVNIGDYNDYFLEYFYARPDANVSDPYRAHLPKIRFARSPDFLLFRDRWGTRARWGIFRGDGSIPMDQQAMDQGHFSLWRGDGYLTKGARNYEALSHGDFFNTLSIENNCRVNGESCSGTAIFDSQKPARITRHRAVEKPILLAYAMLNADGQWNDSAHETNPVANVKSYRRHFVWWGDYAVIFDRLRTKTAGWSKYRLRALSEPQIDGDTVTQLSANGRYKLLQKTLEPESVVIEKVDERRLWRGVPDWVVNRSERHWQSVIDLPVSTHVNVLNVIQMGDADLENFDPLEHLSSRANSGVRIGDRVVCFARKERLRSAVRYTLHNTIKGMWHLVTDLKPGRYALYRNGKKIKELRVSKGDNTALFKTDEVLPKMTIRLRRL